MVERFKVKLFLRNKIIISAKQKNNTITCRYVLSFKNIRKIYVFFLHEIWFILKWALPANQLIHNATAIENLDKFS